MNAIRKKDGFLMEMSDEIYDRHGNEYTWDEVDLLINGAPQSYFGNTDWESLRNQAAIKAMQAQISDHKAMGNIQIALVDMGVTDINGLQKVVAERRRKAKSYRQNVW